MNNHSVWSETSNIAEAIQTFKLLNSLSKPKEVNQLIEVHPDGRLIVFDEWYV